MALALITWGAQQMLHQHKLEHQIQDIQTQKGFNQLHATWLQDVYPPENSWAKGWARLNFSDSGLWSNRKVWLKIQVPEGVDPHAPELFKGYRWKTWVDLSQHSNLRFVRSAGFIDGHMSYLQQWRRSLILHIDDSIKAWPQRARGIFKSLISGDRSEMSRSTRHHFQRLGAMALLAISGLHLAILYGITKSLCPRAYATVIPMLTCTVYAHLGGWSTPLLRAWSMLFIFHLALHFNRKHSGFNALCFCALIEKIINPDAFHDISFLLSYTGVLGIFWMMSCRRQLFKRCPAILEQVFLCSWGAMLWTWPIGAMTFHAAPASAWIFSPLLFYGFGVILLYVFCLLFWAFLAPIPILFSQPLVAFLDLCQYFSDQSSWIFPIIKTQSAYLYLYYGGLAMTWLICRFIQQKKKADLEWQRS